MQKGGGGLVVWGCDGIATDGTFGGLELFSFLVVVEEAYKEGIEEGA